MATCSEIITFALRQASILGAGDQPEASEAEDGLTVLQSLYDQWATDGMFGRLTDVYTTTAYEAKEGERVTHDGQTITFPTTVDDGETRAPRALSCIETISTDDGTRSVKIWENGDWVELLGLESTATAPLSTRGAAGLSACLAVAYVEQFGGEIKPGIGRLAARFRTSLSLKLGSTRETSGAVYF